MSFSQIMVIGNVGRNPDIRHMGDGSIVANFSVAVNDRFTRDGVRHEQTHWFNVDVWQTGERGLVDIVSRFVTTGTQVMVQGRPVMQSWTDKDGMPRQSFRIRLSGPSAQLRLLGGTRPETPVSDAESPHVAGTPEPGPEADAPPPEAPPAEQVPMSQKGNGNGRSRARKPVAEAVDADVPF